MTSRVTTWGPYDQKRRSGRPNDGKTTRTRSVRGQPKTVKLGGGMLRHSPDHGILRLISDDGGGLKQYNTIQYNTIQYNTIQYNTIQYNTIQYNTIQYNTIQYNTIQYNTIQYNTIQYSFISAQHICSVHVMSNIVV